VWAQRQFERADRIDQRREELQEQEARPQARWADVLERFACVVGALERAGESVRPPDHGAK
jgi:hypothetical protein